MIAEFFVNSGIQTLDKITGFQNAITLCPVRNLFIFDLAMHFYLTDYQRPPMSYIVGAFFAAVPGDSQGMLKHAKQFQQVAKTAPAQSRGLPARGKKSTTFRMSKDI